MKVTRRTDDKGQEFFIIDLGTEQYTQRTKEQGANAWPLGSAERVIIALCEHAELMQNNDSAQERYIEDLEEHCLEYSGKKPSDYEGDYQPVQAKP